MSLISMRSINYINYILKKHFYVKSHAKQPAKRLALLANTLNIIDVHKFSPIKHLKRERHTAGCQYQSSFFLLVVVVVSYQHTR